MKIDTVFIFCLVLFFSSINSSKLPKLSKNDLKNLQGPPSEFKEHLLPKPSDDTYETSDSSIKSIYLDEYDTKNHKYQWKGNISCDSESWFTVKKKNFTHKVTIATKVKTLQIYAKRPNSLIYYHLFGNSSMATIVKSSFGFSGKNSIPMTTYALPVYRGKRKNFMKIRKLGIYFQFYWRKN
jgi:hypothetical protein